MQSQDAVPELITALSGEHYIVAFLYPMLYKEICSFITVVLEVFESKGSLLPIIVTPDHGNFLRGISRIGIDNVIGKVEVLRDQESEIFLEIVIRFKIGFGNKLAQQGSHSGHPFYSAFLLMFYIF